MAEECMIASSKMHFSKVATIVPRQLQSTPELTQSLEIIHCYSLFTVCLLSCDMPNISNIVLLMSVLRSLLSVIIHMFVFLSYQKTNSTSNPICSNPSAALESIGAMSVSGGGEGSVQGVGGLHRALHRAHAPQVLVMSTEKADLASRRSSSMGFADLLAPFGVQDGQVPFRTPTRSYGLRDFRVGFVAAADLEPIGPRAAEDLLHEVVLAQSPAGGLDAALRSGPEDSDDLARFIRGSFRQPWYDACRHTLTRTFRHHESEMFGCPIACMIVASTADEDPRGCFEQLVNPHMLPQVFQTGQYDPGMPKYYVLLHDQADENLRNLDAQAVADRLRASLPPNSFFFVSLENSRSLEEPSKADLWAPFMARSLTKQNPNGENQQKLQQNQENQQQQVQEADTQWGAKLTEKDINTLKRFANGLVVSGVLTALEVKLFELDARVTAQRKGLRNTFRSFWRKPKDGNDSSSATAHLTNSTRRVRYLHDSIESNIRLLADLAFMVQDYELALSMYRIARDDFASDREALHQGSALEMMAICNFMRQAPERDTLDYVRRALTCYKEALNASKAAGAKQERGALASIAARFMTKATMLFIDVVLAYGGNARLYREATELLARASLEETPLCAAVLLEQTGTFLVFQELASPGNWNYNMLLNGQRPITSSEGNPMTLSRRLRKFGFHMVMAGLLYKRDRQVVHALRCLATVRNLYQNSRWSHIKDHLASTMADHAAALGDLEHALPFWAEVLARGDEPQAKQATIMDDMEHRMNTSENFDQDASWPFSLPLIDDARVGVHRALNASILPPITSLEHDWTTIPVEDNITTGATESAQAQGREARKRTRAEVRRREEADWNKLHKFLDKACPRPEGVTGEPLETVPKRSRRGKKVDRKPQMCYVGEPVYVDVPLRNPCALKLPISHVQLMAQLVDDQGKILEPQAIEFNVVEKLVLDETSERMVRLHVLPKQPGTLTIIGVQWRLFGKALVKHMFEIRGPRLTDTKEDRVAGAREQDLRLIKTVLPSAAWLGAELELPEQVYEGETMSTNLELINLGASPCVGHIVVGTNAPTLCVGSLANEEGDQVVGDRLAPVVDDGGRAFEIPIEDLGTGLPMSVPVVIRMPRAGRVSLRLLLRYHDGITLRYVRLSHFVEVLPSIRMTARCLESPLPGSDHLLCCSVSNESTRAVNLHRIVSFSGKWSISPLGENQDTAVLAPKESRSFLVRVVRASEPQHQESSPCVLQQSEVTFGSSPEWQLTEDDEFSAPSFESRVHFLCAEHASSVIEARASAKQRFEYYKDKLDAEGKLPTTIQAIRRLRQEGSQNPEFDLLAQLEAATTAAPDEPRPCDRDALCYASRGELLHLMLEWRSHRGDNWALGHADELSLVVFPQLPLKIVLDHSDACAGKVLPVGFRVENVSAKEVSGAVFQTDNSKDVSWRGFTRTTLPDLAPGESHAFSLLAAFHTSGLVNLGIAKVELDGKAVAKCSPAFVSVATGCLSLEEEERNLETAIVSSVEPRAPLQSPPPPPPPPQTSDLLQEESFMWSETSHADGNRVGTLSPPAPVRKTFSQENEVLNTDDVNLQQEPELATDVAPGDVEEDVEGLLDIQGRDKEDINIEELTPSSEYTPSHDEESLKAGSPHLFDASNAQIDLNSMPFKENETLSNKLPEDLDEEELNAALQEEDEDVVIARAEAIDDVSEIAQEPGSAVDDAGADAGTTSQSKGLRSPPSAISKRGSSIELESALREELCEDDEGVEDTAKDGAKTAEEDEDEEEFLKNLEQELNTE